jgi:hypothetical protein
MKSSAAIRKQTVGSIAHTSLEAQCLEARPRSQSRRRHDIGLGRWTIECSAPAFQQEQDVGRWCGGVTEFPARRVADFLTSFRNPEQLVHRQRPQKAE